MISLENAFIIIKKNIFLKIFQNRFFVQEKQEKILITCLKILFTNYTKKIKTLNLLLIIKIKIINKIRIQNNVLFNENNSKLYYLYKIKYKYFLKKAY